MSNIKLIGAVGIKVRPDTDGFKAELKAQLRELQSYDIEVNVDADTTRAKRAAEKLRKEEEGKTLNLKVGVDYDGIKQARSQVLNALKELRKTIDIPVKLDEEGLNKALAKLERMRKSAKVDMEINEDKAGYEAVLNKIRAIQREKIAKTITFKTDNKSLEAEARKYEKLLAELAPAKTITITHRNDHESLDKAIAQIDDALAKLREVTVTPLMNADALLDERNRLQKKLAAKPLIMKVNEDKAGYEKVLAKIVELQKQAAETPISFKTDEASLAAAAAKMRAKIALLTPKPKVTFKYDNDTPGLAKAIEEVDRKIAELGQIVLTADLDEKGLRDAKAKMEAALANSSFAIKLDKDNLSQLERERKRIEELLSSQNATTIIDVKNDEASLEEAKRQLDEMIKDRKASIIAEPVTWEAAMQLAYASRARVVPFYVRINQRSLAIAEGILLSLSGINVLKSSGRALENLVTRFDEISIKAGALGAVVGGVTDALLYMVTALFPVGEGILNVVGLLAMAPAAFSALTATVLINAAAFKNFKSAIDGNAKALAALPPEAQKTAIALRGTWTEIQKPVQASFWKGMGSAMRDSFGKFIPIVSAGLSGAAEHVGRFGAGVFKAFEKIAYAGGPLETMMENLEGFFDNAVGAAEPLVDAMNILGLRGSEYLPKFGTWLTKISEQFEAWITKADEAGKINLWIEQGVQSLKDMWSLGGGTIKMFQGIAKASKEAGAGGLGDVAARFNEIGDMMLREPFQSRLTTIFSGARAGASALNVGLKDLGLSIGEASLFIANLLSGLGQLGGGALSGISEMLGNLQFQSGILRGLTDMNTMVVSLQGGFYDLGSVIGNLARIAGSAFANMGPVINQIIALLDSVVSTLRDDLINTIPGLMSLVGGLISALSGPIQFMATALAGVLSWVNSLGGPMQGLLLSFAAFILLAGKIGPMFATKPGGLLEKIKYDFDHADGARNKFQTGIKGLAAGGLAALGGPWGIAIGAIVAGFSLMGQKAADAKATTDSYAQAIDNATGAITQYGEAMVAKAIWDDKQQAGVKTASEVFRTLGYSIQDVGRIVAQGGPEYDALKTKLQEGAGAAELMSNRMDESGIPIQGNSDKWKEWTGSVNVAGDALNGVALEGAIGLMEKHRGAVQTNKDAWDATHDSVSNANVRLRDFNAAMQIYGDKTGTADQRTRALNQALDILSGRNRTLEGAQLAVNDAMRSASGDTSTLNGKLVQTGGVFRNAAGEALNFTGVIDATTGKINTAGDAGANLYRNLETVTGGVKDVATQMADASAPIADISAFLTKSREDYIAQGVAAGQSAQLVGAAYDYMIGANPKDLLTTITAAGVEDAKTKVKDFSGTVDEVDGRKAIVTLMGDNVPLGVKLEESISSLSEFDKVVATATAGLDPTQANIVRLQLEEDLLRLAGMHPTVLADLDPAFLNRKREQVEADLKNLAAQKPSPIINAEITDAQRKLQTILGLIDNVKPKSVDITVTTKYKQIGNPSPVAGGPENPLPLANGGWFMNNVQMFANGGFSMPRAPKVKKFANGGFETHTAQIAYSSPGTPVRMWAEPETGGEAYIPLSTAKRARSTQILKQVAAQFGYSLSRGSQSFANGGILGGSAVSGTHIHIDAQPGLSYQYAQEVANAAETRFKDAQVLYNILN